MAPKADCCNDPAGDVHCKILIYKDICCEAIIGFSVDKGLEVPDKPHSSLCGFLG